MTKWVTPTKTTSRTTTLLSFLLNFSKSLQLSSTAAYQLMLTTLIIAALAQTTSGFRPARYNTGEGRKLFGGYRITPKHCRATKTLPNTDARASGPTICMFNHECAQRNGEVVGACMDGFLFGACCQIPNNYELESTLINDAQNAYFQQHQQQKLQHDQQQAQHTQQITNAAIAQSYENYGDESLQQASKPKPNIYDQANLNKVYQQLDTSSISNYAPQQPTSNDYGSASSPMSNNYSPQTATTGSINSYGAAASTYGEPDDSQNISDDTLAVTAPTTTSIEEQSYGQQAPQQQQSISSELEQNSALHADLEAANSNTVQEQHPPSFHVQQDSVKISSPSSSVHNDDYVMQVLNTMPPEHEHDHVTFTTEVPMKISNSLTDHTSSESNSFEEELPATQEPTRFSEKPAQANDKPNGIPRPIQQQQQQLVLDSAEFTHSDITHPGADTDLVEDDLQFSTGYGPQPVFAVPPKVKPTVNNGYQEPSTSLTAQPGENQYVLVPTITKDKKPQTVGSPTTSSSITTHDSIESIILQLNNTSAGPSYNIVNQQSSQQMPSQTSSAYEQTPTTMPPYNDEAIETKKPENFYPQDVKQQDYIATQTQLPAYLEPITITGQQSINLQNDIYHSYDVVSDEKQSSTEYQNASPSTSYTSAPLTTAALNEQTDPANNYNDATSTGGQLTSTFNKMPAVGIAYPVDMAYMEEESNLMYDTEEQSQYGQTSTKTTTTQRPTTNSYQIIKQSTEPQLMPTYTRVPSISTQQPMSTYTGVLTSQIYNQVPPEVSVSSQTTKVEEELSTNVSEKPERVPTLAQSSSPVSTTYRPVSNYERPSTSSYISSTSSPVATRPQYDSTVTTGSTSRPVLVTASPKPKPKPKPSNKRPQKRPGTNGNKNPTQAPQPTLNNHNGVTLQDNVQEAYTQPAFNYNNGQNEKRKPIAQQPTNVYIQSVNEQKKPLAEESASGYPQPAFNYNNAQNEKRKPAPSQGSSNNNYPQLQLNQQSTATKTKPQQQPAQDEQQPAGSYNQLPSTALPQPSINYNQQQHVVSSPTTQSITRKPSPTKKPISTSYVTGPSTPRPPTTFNYHYDEVPPLLIADDKIDSFIQSTAQNVASSTPPNYNPSIYLSSVTPINVHNTHKKPGFVKINPTTKQPVPTVLITPKPTVINLVTSSTWTQRPSSQGGTYNTASSSSTTALPNQSSTSFLYSSSATNRPDYTPSTQQQLNASHVTSNDFDDSGYFGAPSSVHPAFTQSTTDATFAVPSDDRPAFPGYYGPTPIYPAFPVPDEKVGAPIEEETYTSPNDFVNFPPVRNPNLNMSAAASAVTNDVELSTPSFVEDLILKDKMNTLVHKIVESLQGNFEALADMIDDDNNTSGSFEANPIVTTRRPPSRKPTRIANTTRPKPTTKRPITRVSTKATTKRPPVTTRRPVSRRTTTSTRRPTTRKPTRKATSTTAPAIAEDEIVDEEDEEDVNPSVNEIDQTVTLSTTASGRKIQCGMRPHVKSGRIVGGKGATFGAYPWQVLVRESTWLGLFTKNKCGGVLITSRYVVTAAHCQPGFLASLVAVFGEFDISGDLESKRAVTKNVKRVIVHRQYDAATFENDLALLELDSPVQFDTHIVPICMPPDRADFTGRMATVTGWGRLKYGGGVPSVLQEVQVPIIENSVCQEMFNTAGHNKKILNSFLCAGYANGQKDSCEGDSGGPLVLQRPDGRYELAGTVSHGIKCAAPYLPGVYMRTTFYKPWLKSITGIK